MISRKVHSEQEKYDVCKSNTVKMNSPEKFCGSRCAATLK